MILSRAVQISINEFIELDKEYNGFDDVRYKNNKMGNGQKSLRELSDS